MPNKLRALLPDKAFLRKCWLVASGTIAGQALVVLSSPLLTRLYTPEEFGLFAVFGALAGIAGTATGLRFEYAVPLLRDDRDAAAMVGLVALTSILLGLAAMVGIWFFGAFLVRAVEAPSLEAWLWLLPPAIVIWGFGSALSYWSVRRGTYGVNGFNRTLQLGSQTAGQVGLGITGLGAPGLILGYVLGYVIRTGHYLWRLTAAERRVLARPSPGRIWRNARDHWRYPAFAFPSSLLAQTSQLAPALLVAVLFGPAMAGFYALGQRIVGLPVRMLSEAGSQVFLGEMRDLAHADLRRLFLRTIILFTGLGLIGMLPVMLFAQPLFVLIFGEAWREAGLLVQLLLPLYLARFVSLPISQLLHALNRQDMHLFLAILGNLALVFSFGAGYLLALDVLTTILLFSLSSTAISIGRLVVCWRLVRRAPTVAAGKDPAALRSPPVALPPST
jgi:O-antigen/teichoic acid export membrane protein